MTPAERERVRKRVTIQIQARADLATSEIDRHTKRLAVVEDQQVKLLHLFYADSVSQELLRREQERINAERDHIEQVRSSAAVEVHDVTEALDEALALTERPDMGYATASPIERRMMNQAVWEKLIVERDFVMEGIKTELYRELDWWAKPRPERVPVAVRAGQTEDIPRSDGNPDLLSGGQGSNVDLMVRPRGLEPPRTIQSTRPSTLRVYQFRHRRWGRPV